MAKRKPKAHNLQRGEGPTPERRQKPRLLVLETVPGDNPHEPHIKRYRSPEECVLDTYFIRYKISELEWRAGMMFRNAYLRAVENTHVPTHGCSGTKDYEMKAVLALQSSHLIQQAYKVLSPAQKSMVVAVCGLDAWAQTQNHFWTLQRGLAVLITKWRLS